jgi:hypothetical protein
MVNYMMQIGDGPNKTLALRGVKDNPPYMHDEISRPHCWRDRSVTAGLHRCSSGTSTRGRERWRLAIRN